MANRKHYSFGGLHFGGNQESDRAETGASKQSKTVYYSVAVPGTDATDFKSKQWLMRIIIY